MLARCQKSSSHPAMSHRTITITLSADRDAVFAFLSRLENLPRWAPAFFRGLRRDGSQWLADTVGGDYYVALLPEARTGVIDLLLGEQPDEMAVVPLRVLSQPHGAAVTCTLFQPADWTGELYELHYAALLADLRGLITRFGDGVVEAPATGGEPFYPSLVTAKFHETWEFYTEKLGFRTACECDSYVHLVHASGAQLGVLRHEIDGAYAELVSATDGRGFWINLDVADADAELARLSAAGVEVVTPLEDKPWGDRQFVVRDPNGVLISIAHRLAETENSRATEAVA